MRKWYKVGWLSYIKKEKQWNKRSLNHVLLSRGLQEVWYVERDMPKFNNNKELMSNKNYHKHSKKWKLKLKLVSINKTI